MLCCAYLCVIYIKLRMKIIPRKAENRETRGVEEAGYKIYSGAPTVSQTTGQMRDGTYKCGEKHADPTH